MRIARALHDPPAKMAVLPELDTLCSYHSLGWKRTRDAHLRDRKSTRLNSSHVKISYAVFCLKKKNNAHFSFIIKPHYLTNYIHTFTHYHYRQYSFSKTTYSHIPARSHYITNSIHSRSHSRYA